MTDREIVSASKPSGDDPLGGVIAFLETGLRTNGDNASDWRSDVESALQVLNVLRATRPSGGLSGEQLRIKELEKMVAALADHPIARLQVGPDGVVPHGTVEALELWKAEADRLHALLAARSATGDTSG